MQLSNANTTDFNTTEFYAFWMNVYNYLAIKLIIENPCQRDMFGNCRPLNSIRDIGEQQPSLYTILLLNYVCVFIMRCYRFSIHSLECLIEWWESGISRLSMHQLEAKSTLSIKSKYKTLILSLFVLRISERKIIKEWIMIVCFLWTEDNASFPTTKYS